jgi:hypothetical protein
MRNRLVITLCAVVSLLAGAGLLTFWLVRSLAPAAALKLSFLVFLVLVKQNYHH